MSKSESIRHSESFQHMLHSNKHKITLTSNVNEVIIQIEYYLDLLTPVQQSITEYYIYSQNKQNKEYVIH